MSALIRSCRPSDIADLVSLLRRSVRELGRDCYSQTQVDAWAARLPDEVALQLRCEEAFVALVYVVGAKEMAAFTLMDWNGHIDLFYTSPNFARQGIGSALYDGVEDEARRRRFKRLTVEASEVAKGFFLGKGFSLLHRRDFEIGDVAIHNYAMEKKLVLAE